MASREEVHPEGAKVHGKEPQSPALMMTQPSDR
jgi:hypothetical protein